MGRHQMSVVLILGTLLLAANLAPRFSEAARFSEEDLEDLDLTPEERAILTQEQVDDHNPTNEKQTGRLAGEDDVEIVEKPEDLDDLVNSNKYVLLQFFAPWCTHCSALQPEFAKAATVLRDEGVVLAKLDAVEHNEFASDYGVEAYPTLYFLIDGMKQPYNGGRTSDAIVTWVKKKIGPAVRVIDLAEEVLDKEIPVAVAYLDSLKGEHAEELNQAAIQQDGVEFYMTTDAEIANKVGLGNKAPALVVLKKQNEKLVTFDETFERNALGKFVAANKLPLIVPFSRHTTSRIFQAGISKQVMLFATSEEFEKIHAAYEEVAKSFKGKIVFVLVDVSDADVANPVLDFFALDGAKTNLLGFAPKDGGSKYLYNGDYSVASLTEFAEKFTVGKLPKYLKSQKAPEKNDGLVKIVVASTFDQIVLDETKDVLLAVYAPWCGHCKSLEPEFVKLAEALKDIPSIVVAKMDGTKNEVERVKVEGYPTLLLFAAADKDIQPMVVSERKAGAVLKFLKSNAETTIDVPDIPEEVDEEEASEGTEVEEDVKDEL